MTFLHPRANEQHASQDQPTLIFFGHAINFSDHLMEVVTSEFRDIRILRCNMLSDLISEIETNRSGIVAIIFDQSATENLASVAVPMARFCPNTHLAIAYSDAEVPPHVLQSLTETAASRPTSLLPMRLQSDSWLAIIRLIMNGEGYLPSSVYAAQTPQVYPELKQAEEAQPEVSGSPSALTPREEQVLELVSQGKQNKVVANELSLSEHTVKLHLHHVIRKLGVRNRTEATLWYLEQAVLNGQSNV